MAAQTQATGAPQPFSEGTWTHARTKEKDHMVKRNQWESELWDDNSGMIFFDSEIPNVGLASSQYRDFAITVPADYKGIRFEVQAESRVDVTGDSINATLQLIANGTALLGLGQYRDVSSAANQFHTVNIEHSSVFDGGPGLIVLTARVTNAHSSGTLTVLYTHIKCRRGRPAST